MCYNNAGPEARAGRGQKHLAERTSARKNGYLMNAGMQNQKQHRPAITTYDLGRITNHDRQIDRPQRVDRPQLHAPAAQSGKDLSGRGGDAPRHLLMLPADAQGISGFPKPVIDSGKAGIYNRVRQAGIDAGAPKDDTRCPTQRPLRDQKGRRRSRRPSESVGNSLTYVGAILVVAHSVGAVREPPLPR